MQPAEAPLAFKHIAIRPPGRRRPVGFRELWRYRELLYFFAWRDLKVRYKQSLVGVGWAVLQPLALMVVFTILFGRLAELPTDGIPRPVFYYAALVPWTYLQQAITQSTNSLIGNGSLLTKVYFPRLLLPISSVVSGLVDFAIAFVMLLGFTAYFVWRGTPGIDLGPAVAILPLLILMVSFTALAVGLWLSALNARYRDVRYAVTFLLQLWLFASPVAYPTSLVPERWRPLYGVNPMVGVIETFRWALTGQGRPSGWLMLVSVAVVSVLMYGGLRYFQKYEGSVADVI